MMISDRRLQNLWSHDDGCWFFRWRSICDEQDDLAVDVGMNKMVKKLVRWGSWLVHGGDALVVALRCRAGSQEFGTRCFEGHNLPCRVISGAEFELSHMRPSNRERDTKVEGKENSPLAVLLIQCKKYACKLLDHFPFMSWVDKLSRLSTRLEKNFKELDLFYQEIIDEHLSKKSTMSEEEDIVDILLQLQKDQSFAIDLTFDHIKAVLMNIFVAGTDTSAATLVWAMAELMKHPRVMKRVQEEVRDIIGSKGVVGEDDLHKLPYLISVVKEILRLHPADPLLVPHETTQQCYIEGYRIRPKTMVYVNAWAIGRDPEAWENPEEFFPERFLGSSIDYKGQDFELIPFGAGRRGCPGIQLGVVTVELALANLLYSFDWELPPEMNKEDIDMDVLPGITMHKKNALCLLPKKYRSDE
ncbi:hypothetical protein F0562_017966 [Nyssa sinensis]|uniref:Cytochrome P450 n=1 Tax=Nyssa sinensis TaxID=561372 RepID=A0A5J4ZBQ2_9ASTE|nr:hypothetical protein F0562_017966 [Nyssa sinensis]